MKSSVFIILAALVAMPAEAANWVLVSSSNNGTLVYIDAESIKHTGSSARAWTKHDYSKVASKKARESMQLWWFQCESETIATMSAIDYSPNGEVISSRSYSYPEYTPVTPDSIGEDIFRIACGFPE